LNRRKTSPPTTFFALFLALTIHVTAAEAAHKAGIAKAAGDEDARIEDLDLAIESMHNALSIYAEVASEPGEAGAIARLNEQAYTPLLEALEE